MFDIGRRGHPGNSGNTFETRAKNEYKNLMHAIGAGTHAQRAMREIP